MLKYHFSYQNPLTHFLQIKLEINELTGDSAIIHLPSWRPGRYELQNFAKRIKKLRFENSEGHILKFEKQSKDRWKVQLSGEHTIIASYQYYAGLMDAGNSWLDDEQLYVNPVNCCFYEANQMDKAIEVHFDLPENYKIVSGLQPLEKHRILAKSYHQLVDSPIFASPSLRTVQYEFGAVEFFIHIQGDLPQSDEKLIHDFLPFTKKQLEVMGGFPCKHYHFLIQSLPYKAYHGVEHWNSTVICLGPSNELSERTLYKELLGVSCHELFHTWNVIRLRPKEMVPYNFQAENYHQTGFVTEGVTTYYGDLFLARSGVFSLEEYLQELNKLLKRHYENEGRRSYSVSESSFDLWLDGYERGVPGRKVSIYNEGALAAMILDLRIRLKYGNQKSLDDVMRLLWERHGEELSGYSFEDYQNACEIIYDDSLQTYFDEIILGLAPFEKYLIPLFDAFGLKMELKNADKPEEDQFGFRLVDNKVDLITTGSPAEELLSINDIILKVNDQPFDGQIIQEDQLTMDVLRMGKKKVITIASDGQHHFQIYQLQLKDDLSNSERKLLEGWLEASFRA